MSYYCELCNYNGNCSSNFAHHKKTKKHLSKSTSIEQKLKPVSMVSIKLAPVSEPNANYTCSFCNTDFKHKSSLSRHKKTCSDEKKINNIIESELIKKDNEFLKKENELLKNLISNANNIINKTQENNKATTEAIKSVSMSALKYANEKFRNTPALIPIQNFNINDLDLNNEQDKKQLVELIIYHAKQKSLDKLLGNHIVIQYKKENPEEQSFHTTDCSRLNYIVRELIENALIWNVDKSGIQICSSIIKPLIKKCIDALLEHQKVLLKEMSEGNLNKQTDVELIINILMSIDSGYLENDINKYIAPYFNLNKTLE
jgi:hypothetical protein